MARSAFVLVVIALGGPGVFAQESKPDDLKWDQKYEQLLKDRPDIRRKVEEGQATKAQVIEWLKKGGDKRSKEKYYTKRVGVTDPANFRKDQDKVVYSGPQPGEKLTGFKVTGLRGEQKGRQYDPLDLANGNPLVLIFQDNSVVGQKGLLLCGNALARIAEKSPEGLHVAATFLVDDPTPSLVFKYNFMDQINDVIHLGVSPDRRDGPGAYGLNRNVAMTIIVAREGKVLHNFAFVQPMLYPDSHLMGAIAEVIGENRKTVARWLNEEKPKDKVKRGRKKQKEAPVKGPKR